MRLLIFVTLGILNSRSISAWLSSSSSSSTTKRQHTSAAARHERRRRNDAFIISNTITTVRHATPFMDAEFERVQERNQTGTTTTTLADDDDDETIFDDKEQQQQQAADWGSKSLLQVALESADPDWNETRIPFLDGPNFIDVKLAFMAELDGVQYGIGVPFDHAAAVTIEQQDGTVLHLSPDDAESEEMIKIMADQLQEHVGKDLKLKMTPRVLTIQGPLEKYTADWRETLVPQPLGTKTLLDDSNEDLQSFHDFMKKELGEEEYAKTMNESPMDVPFDLMDLFGDESLNSSSPPTVEDLLSSVQGGSNGDADEGEDLFIQEMQNFVNKNLSHDGVALKLLSYSLQDGNKYSVVQPLQSVALVAKYTQDQDDVRFDLLSPDDAELLIPRLEDACQKDLQKAGLTGENLIK